MRRLVLLVAATGMIGLVVAVAQSVVVFLGPKVDFPVGSSPLAIVTTDFNKDGRPDIAVVNCPRPAEPPSETKITSTPSARATAPRPRRSPPREVTSTRRRANMGDSTPKGGTAVICRTSS